MIIGGSLGALKINLAVRAALDDLLKTFHIAHICGSGKMDEKYQNIEGYRQFEYVREELPDLFAAADLMISRAGANVINELAAIKKPAILIPLGTDQSRGDQILNAQSFERRGFSAVLKEADLTEDSLTNLVHEVYENRDSYIRAMSEAGQEDASALVTEVILSVMKNKHNRSAGQPRPGRK